MATKQTIALVFGKMNCKQSPETGKYCVSTEKAKSKKVVAWPSSRPTLSQVVEIANLEFLGVPCENLIFGIVFGQMYMKHK